MHIAVVERAAVVGSHHEEADGLGIELLKHIADREEVAQALGHLLVVHIDEAVVHPVAGKCLAGGTFALSDFGFVVRELQVGATAVDIEGVAQQLAGHGRAFNVPARAAHAEGAVPLGVVGLGGFGALPEHRVERIELAVVHRHALARAQLIERLAAEAAIGRKLAHRIVHVAIGRTVGQPLVLELADHGQHLGHILGRTGFVGRALDAQGIGILVQGLDHAIGQRTNGFAVFKSAPDDLVINVGDVAHISHPQP